MMATAQTGEEQGEDSVSEQRPPTVHAITIYATTASDLGTDAVKEEALRNAWGRDGPMEGREMTGETRDQIDASVDSESTSKSRLSVRWY